MTRKIRLFTLMCFCFYNSISAQNNDAIIEGNSCLYSFLKFKETYTKNLKEAKQHFQVAEECCRITGNNSVLIQLFLADTLNILSTDRFKSSLKENISLNNSPALALATAFNKEAIHLYELNPDSTINLLKKSSLLFLKEGRYKDAATCLQNIAFTYEEKQKKYHEAIGYSLTSIYYWNMLKDSIGAGNIYKYLGLLYGKIGKVNLAVANVNKAIDYFTPTHFERGIAVCNYDMALIYFESNKIDSAIYYIQLSKEKWKEFNDSKRIFGINNKLINFYFKKKNLKYAQQILLENQASIEKNADFYWKDKLDFYENAKQFYTLKKNDKEKIHYNNLYTNLIDSLKQKKIKL